MDYNIEKIRDDFPQLKLKFDGKSYTYLDSAASTLKPKFVIDRLSTFYSEEVANVHRGAHHISHISTLSYENARKNIAKFIGATSENEIVFTRSTTESLNLAAHIVKHLGLKSGDEIILTEMEHHSNIVPWQLLAEEVDLKIKYVGFDRHGDLEIETLKSLLTNRTKVVSVCHISNTLGTVNDIETIAKLAKNVGAYTVVDGAQSISILEIDVQKLGCDFFAFSGHKLFAPFGIGILWGKEELLNKSKPYQGGGSMIQEVEKSQSTYLPSPQRFEAGTPNVAGAIALSQAIDYIQKIGLKNIESYEEDLLAYATDELKKIDGVIFVGESSTKKNVLSFNLKGLHHSDVSQLLDQQAVAVRAGHHCTQLIMKKLDIPGTVRASFSIYNNKDDVDRFIVALKKAKEMLS